MIIYTEFDSRPQEVIEWNYLATQAAITWYYNNMIVTMIFRADSRFAPSQWEASLQNNAASHWLGANLESALVLIRQQNLQRTSCLALMRKLWNLICIFEKKKTHHAIKRFDHACQNCYFLICLLAQELTFNFPVWNWLMNLLEFFLKQSCTIYKLWFLYNIVNILQNPF